MIWLLVIVAAILTLGGMMGLGRLPAAVAPDHEAPRQRVHGLCSDTVQAHAELEHVVVVLCARVDARHALDHLAQGNPAPEIPDGDQAPLHRHVNAGAIAHDKLVHRVIHDFINEVMQAERAGVADIHGGALADGFTPLEDLNILLGITVLFGTRGDVAHSGLRFLFGKMESGNITVSIEALHSFIDGIHLAEFYKLFSQILESPQEYFS